jgi:ribosomal protein S18 acetylase RimI-like enzyme
MSARERSALVVGVVPRADVRALQWSVLRGGPLPDDDASLGSDVVGAFSLAARQVELAGQGMVVGAATFYPEDEPGSSVNRGRQWRLRGMATHPAHQGSGVGSAVLAAGLSEVVARGGTTVWCNARSAVVGFYRSHGFVTVGGEFATPETGIPHFRARRDLLDLTDPQADPAPGPPAPGAA